VWLFRSGEFISYQGQVVEVSDLRPVIPPEVGNDDRNMLLLELCSPNGDVTTIKVNASDGFELEIPPGSDESMPRRRQGVSSESGFGADKVRSWKKVVVLKTPDERENIRRLVRHNVFFDHLDEIEENEMIDVVFEKRFESSDVLMKQGDEGDLFYVIESGEADIYVSNEHGQDILVRECKLGDSFGELALMYNAPRNATVKARTTMRCWCMDRENFKYVIMGGSIKKQERYLSFIDSIEIFSTMDRAEKLKLVDALIPRKVKAGSVVVRQGDVGDMFYIVEHGLLIVEQKNLLGELEVVNEKGPGNYFGEIALIADMMRSATVTAKVDCVLLTVDRKSFISVLGPVQPLLRRSVALYKTYVDYTAVAEIQ